MIRENGTSTIETFDINDQTVIRDSESKVYVIIDKKSDRANVVIGDTSFGFPAKLIGSVSDVMRHALESTCVPA